MAAAKRRGRCATRFYQAGIVITLTLAVPIVAQQPGANNFFTGVNPRNLTMNKIDTTQALKKYNFNTAFRNQNTPKTFNLGGIFPKISMPSWPPKIASTPVLPKAQNQFQPNPIFGKNPFGS